MKLSFTKMHGLGNDFVVIDAIHQNIVLTNNQYRHIADRRFGVGCDQILLVESPKLPDTDFHYRIINADGSEVEACGNGARCFARFVREKGLSNEATISVGTLAGPITLKHLMDGLVEVDMGVPVLEPEQIPFIAPERSLTYPLEIDGVTHEISAVSMGNPHAVLRVPDVTDAPVEQLGPIIERHERFPQRVNAGFMQIDNPSEIHLRVFERGTGETLACGTGACAAVVAGVLLGQLNSVVQVHLPGGDLVIEWPSEDHSVLMRGAADTVYEGIIEL
ncbi:MAG: diaminopimelate epimerase [Candidatus Thiodiazotropha sp. (ex Semelilucina semeliformis)]|nr:diaminopimelate epimerase [Candidatus Thiodiazotropha sp. (ex Semelilucina semeliformis)]